MWVGRLGAGLDGGGHKPNDHWMGCQRGGEGRVAVGWVFVKVVMMSGGARGELERESR